MSLEKTSLSSYAQTQVSVDEGLINKLYALVEDLTNKLRALAFAYGTTKEQNELLTQTIKDSNVELKTRIDEHNKALKAVDEQNLLLQKKIELLEFSLQQEKDLREAESKNSKETIRQQQELLQHKQTEIHTLQHKEAVLKNVWWVSKHYLGNPTPCYGVGMTSSHCSCAHNIYKDMLVQAVAGADLIYPA